MNKKISILLFTIILLFSCIYTINFYTIYRKYSDDYLAVDYVRAKNIVSEERVATAKEFEKYDVNKDGKITEDDLLIMKCLICEVFDVYEVRNIRHRAIEYVKE